MSGHKVRFNELGHGLVTLPQSGIEVKLRQPKGKDLVSMELAAKEPDQTNVGIMMRLITILMVEPEMTYEQVEDMDAEDIVTMAEVLKSFRGLGKLTT